VACIKQCDDLLLFFAVKAIGRDRYANGIGDLASLSDWCRHVIHSSGDFAPVERDAPCVHVGELLDVCSGRQVAAEVLGFTKTAL